VEVVIGKFLLDLYVKNILARKSTCSGCMLASSWLNVSLRSGNGWHGHVENWK
jgi:hypothetical protein